MKSLQRRVLVTLLGVPDQNPATPTPARHFEQFPLRRRVAAGLLGVSLDYPLAQDRVQDNTAESEARPMTGDRPVRAVVRSGAISEATPGEEADNHEPLLVPYLLGHPPTKTSDVPYSGAEVVEHVGTRPERLPDRKDARLRPWWVSRFMQPAAVGALGVVLTLGGVWFALGHQDRGDRDSTPYGSVISVADPFKAGDCVVVDWPGAGRFQGTPKITVDPTCSDMAPDGQVMAVVEATTATEARSRGGGQCEVRTRGIRDKLADVRSFAVAPNRATFEAAGRRVACFVLGAHGPLYGPLGSYRKLGTALTETATMQKGDCLQAHSNREARLVSCSGAHDEMVLGFTRLGTDVTLSEARTESDAACAKDVPPRDYGFGNSVYTSGSWTSEGPWKSGTHVVVCTVRKQNGGSMEGDRPS
ncbi:septum formation family protein [Streptomyces sp. NPDC094149]|uniref:septum formation family protein n=1 Tax=Streptomyces sp. NPDC094149 TaxID=3155079 RepID=UPI003318A11D